MNEKEREWIQKETSEFISDLRQSGIRMVSACRRVGRIEEFLKGKPMTITNWMRLLPDELGINERTGWNLLKRYRRLREVTSDSGIDYLAERGIAGFNDIGVNRLLPVLEKNPSPKTSDPKILEGWKEKVREDMRKSFTETRKKVRKLDPEEAMKAWLVVGVRLIRECKLENSTAEKAWTTKALGYFMEKRAMRGTVSAVRTPIPDGWWKGRGAPRGPRKRKDKAA